MKTLVIFPDRAPMWTGTPDLCRARFPQLHWMFAHGLEDARPLAGDAEAILAFALDPAVVDQASSLRWVQALGAGLDGLAPLARRPEVIVTGAQGLHGPAVSEAVIAMMLALSRRLPAVVRDQDAGRWSPRVSDLLEGKTVGILGTGRIAEALARKCRAFDLRVVGFSASPRPVDGFEAVLPREELRQAAGALDYLVLLAALTPDTLRLADADLFAAMKPSSYLINVGRGGLVDEAALTEALTDGQIAGAALDVFDEEPPSPGHPFWTQPNLLMTPHSAGRRTGYFEGLLDIFARNLAAYRDGRADRMPTRVSL